MAQGRRSRTVSGMAVALLACTVLAGTLPAHAGQLDAGLAIGSDYVVNGVTRSRGHAVVQGQLGYATESGWNVGTWFSTVDFRNGPDITRELDVYLSRRWRIGRSFTLLTEVTQYTFDEPAGHPSYDYSEMRLALSFRELFEVSASLSPDYSGYSSAGAAYEEKVYTYAFAARRPLSHRLTLSFGAGRQDVSRLFGSAYHFWSAGGELTLGRFDFALSWIGTDGTAERLFGRRADDRVVATLAVRFP